MKYTITVCRTAYAFRDIVVEAKSAEEAKEIALDEAGNHLYSERESTYSAEGILEGKV